MKKEEEELFRIIFEKAKLKFEVGKIGLSISDCEQNSRQHI